MNQEQFNYYLDNCERYEEDSDSDDDTTYYANESSEEENPSPQWNLPNWKGNASDMECPCIKQVLEDGSTRGCADCDEYWDMPSLVGDTDQKQCEGCYLLANGLGCDNQLCHSCMEHF